MESKKMVVFWFVVPENAAVNLPARGLGEIIPWIADTVYPKLARINGLRVCPPARGW